MFLRFSMFLVKILQINYLQGGLKNVKKGSFGSACDFAACDCFSADSCFCPGCTIFRQIGQCAEFYPTNTVKHLYELIHLCIWERGYDRLVDFNSDGSVNSTDLMILNRAVLGLGGLPVPIEIGDIV